MMPSFGNVTGKRQYSSWFTRFLISFHVVSILRGAWAQECNANGVCECRDYHPRCKVWAEMGECAETKDDMSKFCAKSCNTCSEAIALDSFCMDSHPSCSFWASHGECVINRMYMEANCQKSCGTCNIQSNEDLDVTIYNAKELAEQEEKRKQKVLQEQEKKKQKKKAATTNQVVDDGDPATRLLNWSETIGERQSATGLERGRTLNLIQESKEYLETVDLPTEFIEKCKNLHELCSFWALSGECDANSAYMKTSCAPACKSCDMIDFDVRCPPKDNLKPALRPGDLNKMFERIVKLAPGNQTTLTAKQQQKLVESKTPAYSVVVLSRPSTTPATEVSAVQDKSSSPWVIVLDNFLTNEEADEMIQIGYQNEYQRSEDVGPERIDGTHESVQHPGRTSENAWCSGDCREEELPVRIHTRIENILQIPANNSEDFQILKYEVGQFYNTHHDYIEDQMDRQCGPRILTFFMYLNDVEKGGGTNFPKLGITVTPKKGRALLWPSVFDSDPMRMDNRFDHQALPVEAGEKFAVNSWIHMYDHVTPQLNACI